MSQPEGPDILRPGGKGNAVFFISAVCYNADNRFMKKIMCMLFFMAALSFSFSEVVFEAGLGSGYVFYGDDDLKDVLSDFDQDSQMILCGEAAWKFGLAQTVYLAFGADSVFDGRWKGSNHVYLWDYCGFAGFDVYPGFGGLCAGVQYCFGRRTNFLDLPHEESDVSSTGWGNGFAFALSYDFFYNKEKGLSPVIAAAWRHMPRGGSSDDILEVKVRIRNK